MAGFNINPMATTTAAGSFATESSGFIAGTAQQDPNIRNQLVAAMVDLSVTTPIYGGLLISENVPTPGYNPAAPSAALGSTVKLANTVTNPSGFGSGGVTGLPATGITVFDQAHAMMNTPGSPVPVALAGMTCSLYRFGSGARIALPCDGAMAVYEAYPVNQKVSWDFTANQLVPYAGTYAADTITNAVWSGTNGGQVAYTVSSDISSAVSAGDEVEISGVVNTGGAGGATGVFNGKFTVLAITSTTLTVSYPATGSPGTYASGGSVLAGGGALPVKVLEFNFGNSMVPVYNPATGVTSWNRAGSCAVVELRAPGS